MSRLFAKLFPRRFVQHSLATHLSGVFAIEPEPLRRAVDEARARLAATPSAEIRALATRRPEERASILELEPMDAPEPGEDGTPSAAPMPPGTEPPAAEALRACIPIHGTIVRGDASCARFMGIEATGLAEIERALHESLADARVKEICLEVSSPGGVATGVAEVADLIAAGRAQKPIRAEVCGIAASAAYWLISQCTTIEAERSALLGSIGCYAVIEDSSKEAELEGCKVHVLRSGPQKGVGVEGAPVTPEQLAAEQVVVDDLAALFASSVAEGRGMSIEAARALATGEVWIASKALERGLIDGIASPEVSSASMVGAEATNAREGGEHTAALAAAVQEDIVSKEELSALAERLAKMEQKQVALEAENAELKAADKVRQASLAEAAKARKASIIADGVKAGRIVGDMAAAVNEYAATVGDDTEKLAAFVARLPVQVTPTAIGATGDQGAGSPGALSAEDRHTMAALGISEEAMRAAGSVDFISITGKSGVKVGADGKKQRLALVKEVA